MVDSRHHSWIEEEEAALLGFGRPVGSKTSRVVQHKSGPEFVKNLDNDYLNLPILPRWQRYWGQALAGAMSRS
jgi:hypothetical protein